MNAGPFRAALAALALLASASAPTAQPVGGTPPEDIHVEVSRSQAGIALSTAAITLQKGGYYRLNLACLLVRAAIPPSASTHRACCGTRIFAS
ncbi:MAG: hypothetical protein CMP81_11975 [Fulvimarina sp.]|nr:hypothetical protein [Fulvimarina sp.]